MKKLMALFFVLSTNSFSYEEIWKMGESYIPLLRYEKDSVLVSKNCNNKECHALKVLKLISFKKINNSDLVGGKNPGAVLCSSQKDGRIIYLKDMSGNENTFCFFKDKSFVSTSTLMIYADRNDGASK